MANPRTNLPKIIAAVGANSVQFVDQCTNLFNAIDAFVPELNASLEWKKAQESTDAKTAQTAFLQTMVTLNGAVNVVFKQNGASVGTTKQLSPSFLEYWREQYVNSYTAIIAEIKNVGVFADVSEGAGRLYTDMSTTVINEAVVPINNKTDMKQIQPQPGSVLPWQPTNNHETRFKESATITTDRQLAHALISSMMNRNLECVQNVSIGYDVFSQTSIEANLNKAISSLSTTSHGTNLITDIKHYWRMSIAAETVRIQVAQQLQALYSYALDTWLYNPTDKVNANKMETFNGKISTLIDGEYRKTDLFGDPVKSIKDKPRRQNNATRLWAKTK